MNPQEPGYYDWLRKMVDSNLPKQLVPPITPVGPLHDPVVTTGTARRSDHTWDAADYWKFSRSPHEHHTHIHTAIFDEAWGFAAKNKESSMNRTEVITAELARLQDELATRSKFGEDYYVEGTVLKFKADYNGDKSYTFAAIKAADKWYLTGRESMAYSWSQLVDFFISTHTTKVWGMAKAQRIV